MDMRSQADSRTIDSVLMEITARLRDIENKMHQQEQMLEEAVALMVNLRPLRHEITIIEQKLTHECTTLHLSFSALEDQLKQHTGITIPPGLTPPTTGDSTNLAADRVIATVPLTTGACSQPTTGAGIVQLTMGAGSRQPTTGAGIGQPTLGAGIGQPTKGAGMEPPTTGVGDAQATTGEGMALHSNQQKLTTLMNAPGSGGGHMDMQPDKNYAAVCGAVPCAANGEIAGPHKQNITEKPLHPKHNIAAIATATGTTGDTSLDCNAPHAFSKPTISMWGGGCTHTTSTSTSGIRMTDFS